MLLIALATGCSSHSPSNGDNVQGSTSIAATLQTAPMDYCSELLNLARVDHPETNADYYLYLHGCRDAMKNSK
jgi:hypothetical protein